MPLKHAQTAILFAATTLGLWGCAYLSGNFRVVEEAHAYRSGQLNPRQLAQHIRQHTIRTVVSLREPEPEASWYQKELDTCKRLGVAHVDIPWSMKRLPEPESLSRLIEVFQKGPHPVLVHCHGGVHRSAVAAAVHLLMQGETVEVAREQLGRFFNNAPIGRLLDLYESGDEPFAAWVHSSYPAIYEAEKRNPD